MPNYYSENEGDLLINVDKKLYGSAPKYLQSKADNNQNCPDPSKFAKNWLEICTKILKSLSTQPEPYATITEIERDFVLVYTNCWYWNFKTPQYVNIARNGLLETRKLFMRTYQAP